MTKARLNRIIFVFLFCITSVSFLACQSEEIGEKVIIKGQIKNAGNTEIILQELNPLRIYQVASVFTDDDGFFKIELDMPEKSFYRLKVDENNAIHLFLKTGKSIEIGAEYPRVPRNYSVKGSENSILLKEINNELIKSTDKLNALRKDFTDAVEKGGVNIDSLRREFLDISDDLYQKDRQFLINFIKENKESPVIFVCLYQYVLTNPILEIKKDIDIFEFVLENLEKHHPDLAHTAYLNSEISKHRLQEEQIRRTSLNVRINSPAPEINLKDIKDNQVLLSDFRGDYLLMHFWASWNNQSVEETKYLKNIYDKLSEGNFEILQISLDANKNSWKNAIESNNLKKWHHASDLAMWDGPTIQMYGITTIPINILLSPEGVVLAVNIRPDKFEEEIPQIISSYADM